MKFNDTFSSTGQPATKAMYIAFEGMDRCGKTTQVRILAERIGAAVTREPGGQTALGAAIRQLVLQTDSDITPRCEALLFAADRAQHAHEFLRPTLNKGQHVISDRSLWSGAVYQGAARGLGVDAIVDLNYWATEGLVPDVVVWLDGGFNLHERDGQLDRIESQTSEFHNTAAAAFAELAEQHNWLRVDATGTIDEVATAVAEAVAPFFDAMLEVAQ